MSEQVNPTADEEDRPTAADAPFGDRPPRHDARPARPTSGSSSFDDDADDADDADDVDDADDADETDDAADTESDRGGDSRGDRYAGGPVEYVQRERSGRGRRIGSEVKVQDVDYKNLAILSRFLDRRGRILSRRKTRVSARVQRRIVTAIKRARHMALLPYTADQTRIVRRRR